MKCQALYPVHKVWHRDKTTRRSHLIQSYTAHSLTLSCMSLCRGVYCTCLHKYFYKCKTVSACQAASQMQFTHSSAAHASEFSLPEISRPELATDGGTRGFLEKRIRACLCAHIHTKILCHSVLQKKDMAPIFCILTQLIVLPRNLTKSTGAV